MKLSDTQKLRKNDILICAASGSTKHLGKVALAKQDYDFYFGGFMGVLRSSSNIIPALLYSYLCCEKFKKFVAETTAGANIQNLKFSVISDFQIPLPPLKVQEQIVAEIEGYQKIVTAARQIVETYKPHIDIDPSWPMVELGNQDFFEIEAGGTPSSKENNYWNGTILWATLVDLPAADYISTIENTERTITEEGLKYSSAKMIPANSVIVSTRATIGRVGINKKPICTNQGFKNVIVKNRSGTNVIFVAHMIKRLEDRMNELATGGTFKELSKTIFCSLSIPLPDLRIQDHIVAQIEKEQEIVNANKRLIEIFQQKIKDRIAQVWGEK